MRCHSGSYSSATALGSLPPWQWGGTLGFVLAAVSPAVVVPGMLSLQERGYGTGKGIPTLVMAAASFDDVIAISGFGLCLAFAVAHEEDLVSTETVRRRPPCRPISFLD